MKKKNAVKLILSLSALVAVMIISVFFISNSVAQSKKEDLQKQREEINEKIALTKKLIKESESNQKVTSSQLAILNEQLAYREQLLKNINRDISNIDGEIGVKENNVLKLNGELDRLKTEYGRMIAQAYKNRSSYDKLMYIFASDNFNQAYRRWKLTQHYAEVRKRHVAQIENTKVQISENISQLQNSKEQKEQLAFAKEKEKNEISTDKLEKQKKLTTLQKEEKKLRDQQKKQEADRKKLSAKIEEIIQKEIAEARRKEREREEAEAKKREGAVTPGVKPPTETAKKPALSSAPEVLAMNADFEKNKGNLPWPVPSGIITQRFGKHPHASIAGIEVNSNGIDFTADKDASVLNVFEGKVTSIFTIPGAGQNVIVTHGTYKTVYSGLNSVSVSIGDKVSIKQKLGTVLFDGEDYTLHFEVWKVNAEAGVAQNPELWLKRR